MERGHPFKRACAWCGASFQAPNNRATCCSLGCEEEVHQHLLELSWAQNEFREISERVEELHEQIFRFCFRIERQVEKLRRLGVQWSTSPDEESLFKIEREEKKVSRVLARLNAECARRDEEALPQDRRLFALERAITHLKRLVGE